jgi:hypothetical protein
MRKDSRLHPPSHPLEKPGSSSSHSAAVKQRNNNSPSKTSAGSVLPQ